MNLLWWIIILSILSIILLKMFKKLPDNVITFLVFISIFILGIIALYYYAYINKKEYQY